jgi:hypothetical protein
MRIHTPVGRAFSRAVSVHLSAYEKLDRFTRPKPLCSAPAKRSDDGAFV